jgi:hypothetical protein
MATTYLSGVLRTANFSLACHHARSVSAESRSDENVYLRSERIARDVLVAAYRSGHPVAVGDVPRDTVLRTLREHVGNVVL